MNRALAIITVLSLFVAGVAVGALGMNLYATKRVDLRDRFHRHGGDFFFNRLHRALDLTEDQEREIEAILRRTHDEAYELRRELHPKVMELMDRAHAQIEEILEPDQREEFRRIVARSRRKAERFFLGSPGGHGPPPHREDRFPSRRRPDGPAGDPATDDPADTPARDD